MCKTTKAQRDALAAINSPKPERRRACILICAPTGDVNAARALVGRAIRKTLSVRRWRTGKHMVTYMSMAELRGYGDAGGTPRFLLDVTDADLARVWDEIERLAECEGWTRPPVDIYHD